MWSKDVVWWIEGNTAFVSVPFTWLLPQAYKTCERLRSERFQVRAGGPAVMLNPEYLAPVAYLGGDVSALRHHNPEATYTSRGCIRNCSFCAVWRIEGTLEETEDYIPRKIVCDNNVLACSRRHFERMIDRERHISGVDFNQGLDCRLLREYHIDGLKALDKPVIRFSWDFVNLESEVMTAIQRMLKAGFPKSRLRIYVLIGFKDTPADALYRFQTLKAMGIDANPQRYQPLDELVEDSYVEPGWTNRELKRFQRYWANQRYFRKVPFAEFNNSI